MTGICVLIFLGLVLAGVVVLAFAAEMSRAERENDEFYE